MKRLVRKIVGLFIKTKKQFTERTGRIIDFRKTCWGHNIMSIQFNEKTITSSCLIICTPVPEVGDELLLRMKTGKVGICRVLKSKPCRDPEDMAEVEFGVTGYYDESKEIKQDSSTGFKMLR